MSSPSQWQLDYVLLPKGSIETLIRLKVAQRKHAYAKFVGAVPETDIDEAALLITCLEDKWISQLDGDMFAAVVVFTQDQADIEFETELTYEELDWEHEPCQSFSDLSLLVEDIGMEAIAERSLDNWGHWADQPGLLPAAIEEIVT